MEAEVGIEPASTALQADSCLYYSIGYGLCHSVCHSIRHKIPNLYQSHLPSPFDRKTVSRSMPTSVGNVAAKGPIVLPPRLDY